MTFKESRDSFVKEVSKGTVRISPLVAINHFCNECMGDNVKEKNEDCQGYDCPLYQLRTGVNKSGGGRGVIKSKGSPFPSRKSL